MNRQELISLVAKNNIPRTQLKQIIGERYFRSLILSADSAKEIPSHVVSKVNGFLSININDREPQRPAQPADKVCEMLKQDFITYLAKRNISRNQVKQVIGSDNYDFFIRNSNPQKKLPKSIVNRVMNSLH